jgi:hypothetical protein
VGAYGELQVKLHVFITCAVGEGESWLFDRGISDLHWLLDRVLGGFQSVSEDCVEGMCVCVGNRTPITLQ